ncbi:MAG: LysR family transcriptional regulator [Verrucomicrobia bacterium]|nr:LysR family transcriptional regulator [Verrucomicrobiota bacterium]
MTQPARPRRPTVLRPRFRVLCGSNIALGPGKVELLTLIRTTGSIARAAKRMGMSYMRAWLLIQTMECCFRQPLVHALRGGKRGGGAKLTATGKQALALYHRMQTESLRATRQSWRNLQKLLLR